MNEKLTAILNDRKTTPIVAAVVAFAGGFTAGYFFAKRDRYEVYEFEDTLSFGLKDRDEEIRMKPASVVIDADVLDEINKRAEVISEGEAFIAETIEPIDEPEEEVEPVRQSVFETKSEEWDYPAELAARSKTVPYVIHRDEFFGDEMGFTQTSVTYYEGDNIAADEDDKPIYNFVTVAGEMKFGHGSGDPNVFYVRNEERRAEYEILRHEGQYSIEVLGLEIENNERVRDIKHSNNPRFRMD